LKKAAYIVLFLVTTLNVFSQGTSAAGKKLDGKVTQSPKGVSKEKVFTVAEEMPQFPGEDSAMYKFMEKNVIYPATAKENGIEGKAWVKFVVNKNGEVVTPAILKSAGNKALDDEALRVVKLMPVWKPGKNKGKAVACSYNLPIAFKLDQAYKSTKATTVPPEPNASTIPGVKEQTPEPTEKYTLVEEMPEFVNGGMEGLKKYVAEHLQYPQSAKEQAIEGTVFIKLLVRADGSTDEVTLLRGIAGCPDCDKEAMRVMKELPKWKPGKQNGKNVNVYYNFPVRFKLAN
jgi:TonB family protein